MEFEIIKDLGMRKEGGTSRRWCMAKCPHCGNVSEHRTQSLKTKKSCGCATHLKARTTHGKVGTREYQIWADMKHRCNNPNNPRYPRYGGRGITYTPTWESFESFWEDMKDTYQDHLTLDRIDNDGNYELENCRWATDAEQYANRASFSDWKSRDLDTYARKVSLEALAPFIEKYKVAKKGEKAAIKQEVSDTLGISIHTAGSYLSKGAKGTLCKLQ